MKRVLLSVGILVLWTGVALAASGDFVNVQGQVVQQSGNLLVIRDQSGRNLSVDITSAMQNERASGRSIPALRQGDRVTVVGAQGASSDQVMAYFIEPAGGSVAAQSSADV